VAENERNRDPQPGDDDYQVDSQEGYYEHVIARLNAKVERLTRIETAAQRVCDNPIWAGYGVGVIEEMDDLRAELARKEADRG